MLQDGAVTNITGNYLREKGRREKGGRGEMVQQLLPLTMFPVCSSGVSTASAKPHAFLKQNRTCLVQRKQVFHTYIFNTFTVIPNKGILK